MAEPVFDAERNLKSVKVYPLELGFKHSRTQRGQPYPASAEVGRTIIERLNRLSQPFGVSLANDAGVGVASWKK